MAKKDKGTSKNSRKERRERRFLPQSTGKSLTVKVLGGLGAGLLGAGAWAQFGRALMGLELPPYAFAPWVLAGGATLFGAAVWMGTSGEPAVRVGSGGIGLEKGELRRMPWYGVKSIAWDNDRETLKIEGSDETDREMIVTLTARAHPQACAWILKEGNDRIPKLVLAPEKPRGVPEPGANEGQAIVLDPVQVVGRRCMASNTSLLYEPDARVCPKCERIYHKHHVPDECACGASLAGMRVTADSA